ncbi:MAG: hypothetical protein V3S24_08040 [Candidatus Tectomicrobia bacterium]
MGKVYRDLSAKQTEALKLHEEMDSRVYELLKDTSQLASDSVSDRVISDMRRTYAEALLKIHMDIKDIVRAEYKAGVQELRAIQQPKIDAADLQIQGHGHQIQFASSATRPQLELSLAQAKTQHAEQSAILFDAQLELQEHLSRKADETIKAAKGTLDAHYQKALASAEAGRVKLALELFVALDLEFQALKEIKAAHEAIDSYLNRPSAVALVLHGGLNTAGIPIKAQKIDNYVNAAGEKLRQALYSFGSDGSGKTSLRIAGDTFKELAGNLGRTVGGELEEQAKALINQKIDSLGGQSRSSTEVQTTGSSR